jgi:hypothetical protein
MFNYRKIINDIKDGNTTPIISIEEYLLSYHIKCNRDEAKNKQWFGVESIDISEYNTICIPISKDQTKQLSDQNEIKSIIENNKKSLNGSHVTFGSTCIPIVLIDYFPEWKIGLIKFNEDEWENINKNGNIITFNMEKGDNIMKNCQIYYNGIYTEEICHGTKKFLRTYVPFKYN